MMIFSNWFFKFNLPDAWFSFPPTNSNSDVCIFHWITSLDMAGLRKSRGFCSCDILSFDANLYYCSAWSNSKYITKVQFGPTPQTPPPTKSFLGSSRQTRSVTFCAKSYIGLIKWKRVPFFWVFHVLIFLILIFNV